MGTRLNLCVATMEKKKKKDKVKEKKKSKKEKEEKEEFSPTGCSCICNAHRKVVQQLSQYGLFSCITQIFCMVTWAGRCRGGGNCILCALHH